MAKWIKTTGEIVDVQPKRVGKKFSLEELQGFVGGYIEAVRLPKREVMVCNEEGKLHGLPLNHEATAIAYQIGLAQEIVGDVLICPYGGDVITAKTKRIAELNDLARRAMGVASTLIQTPGISDLPDADQSRIRELVETFNGFSPDNNPFGERDFGMIEYNDLRIYWKIDYYAKDMQHGSEAPEDPGQTQRVLTIMLAEEY